MAPRRSTLPPPRTNRLSEAPSAARDAALGPLLRDSFHALSKMVCPDDLSVVFQPIVLLETGETFAYEALVRCQLSQFSPPPVLFERALALGCVGRLGRMIREIAVPLCAERPLFLNVHPQELNESWLIRPDDPILTHEHDIFLEITESVPLTHFDRCLGVIQELRARGGIHLVVDDLGAGYSNLKTIADLEPRFVKLDRGLIAGIDKRPRQRQLVAGVVRMCEDLEADVVAEGIETVDEYDAVRDAGATYAQGFLFAHPGFPLPKVTWPPLPTVKDMSAAAHAPTLILRHTPNN